MVALVKGPPPSPAPLDGREPIRNPGYSYVPGFIGPAEAAQLERFFGTLHPLWEQRHAPNDPSRRGSNSRLTRPVYWLGAWQFAALGYYSEPDHVAHRCLRAEPMPEVMLSLLERLRPELALHGDERLPNTCLINFYGRTPKAPGQPPVDHARLRMHRDAEPGPVVMFSIGEPAQFEFVEPTAPQPAHSQWIRGRSAVVLSGPEYKDRLYHRVTRVRIGERTLPCTLPDFDVRRVSVSFRHVPEHRILDLADLEPRAREVARPYVTQLAEHSAHYRKQLGA